ncbi:hypothetical protein BHM03_00026753 [Ensete ventricosum]|nr:hypothetical protein BHM03_00026753 [Ensete ventricosum]
MMEAYNDNSDPMEYVVAFRAQMTLYGTSDAIMCQAFPSILCWTVRMWYNRLKPTSICSFDQLAKVFESNFLASARPRPTMVSLLEMRQREDESLGQYLTQFTMGIRAIPDAHLSLVIQAFLIGLWPSCFFWSLLERPPATVLKMLQRVN